MGEVAYIHVCVFACTCTCRMFCGTWNVNGQHAMQRMDKFLMCDKQHPHIFAIG